MELSLKTFMISLNINRRKLSIALVSIFAALFVANVVGIFLRYKWMPKRPLAEMLDRFLNMDREANLPTYFNTILLFIVAQTFFLMGKSSRSRGDSYFYTYWYFLSLIFVFMSIDELASIHELFVAWVPVIFGFGGAGIFKFAWIIPYGILVIALGIYSIRFLLSLKKAYRIKYLIAGAIYISGAIGMETLGGLAFERNYGITSFDYLLFFTTPEETMEMLALIYMIDINLSYLADPEAGK